jgi:hypothetical protein
VRDWNLLPPDIVELDTPEAFKARIVSLSQCLVAADSNPSPTLFLGEKPKGHLSGVNTTMLTIYL